MNVRGASLAMAGLLALVFLSQGLTAPFEKDEESRPAGITADIVHHGHWMLPADVYGEVTRKPPLYYWLSAAIAMIRGGRLDEAGARLLSLLAGAALAVVVMGYAGAWIGGRAGWLGWLVLLSCYGFCSHAGYARTDMLFTLLIFGAYCLLYPAVEGDGSARHWLPAGMVLALAILTKGPLAVLLCALGIAIYLLLTRRNPLELALRPWPWLTLMVAAAVASAWYVPAFVKTHGAVAGVQLMQENLGHFVPARLGGTGEASRPFYYLLVRFIGTSLPFSLYVPALIAALIPLRKVGHPQLYQLGLLLAVLGFFSIASAKRDDYILPAFPPFAIVLAAMLTAGSGQIPSAADRLRDLAGLAAGLAMLAMAALWLILSDQGGLAHRLSAHLQSSDAAYLRLFAAGGWRSRQAALMLAIAAASTVSLIAWRRARPVFVATAVALAAMAGVSLWIGIIRPELAVRRTFKAFAIAMRTTIGGAPIYTPGGPDYEISYYYGAPIRPLSMIPRNPEDSSPRYVLVWDNWLSDRKWAGLGREILASRPALDGHRLVLLKIDANRFEPFLENH
ncbi:MAG TPA: glycosyltransferase family 39 protein [Candidatus Binataceae bacterium]